MYRHVFIARQSLRTAPRFAARRYATDGRPTSSIPSTMTPLTPPAPSPASAKAIPTVTVTSTGPVPPVKPVVVLPAESTTLPPPPSSSLPPPPPPPPPRPPRRFLRRFLLYTTIATLIFYPTSAIVSTHSDRYREFFVNTFPFGEAIADYAEDNQWDQLNTGSIASGAKSVTEKSKELVDRVKGRTTETTTSTTSTAQEKARELKADVTKRVDATPKEAKSTLRTVEDKFDAAKAKTESKLSGLKKDASKSAESLKASAADAQSKAVELVDAAKAKTAEVVETVKDKASEAAAHVQPIHFSDGVEHLVTEAEKALGIAKSKAESASSAVASAGQAQYPDTLPARGVKAEGPGEAQSSGKQLYTGPPLPLGFEPPYGYYVAKPAASDNASPSDSPVKAESSLPLLAPTVKDFAAEEPIISQLASTIDSLASSLSATSSAATSTDSTSPSSILSKAKDDLTSLSSRFESLKAHEKSELEKTVQEKTSEFEKELEKKQHEWRNKEGELQAGWQEEKEKLLEGWRKVLDRELEGQRSGIEQRLREEVIAQGIELQRRWLRSIKAQVESERGGRLAKLDNLTSSFKQLERITLDNSSQLDANVSLHTLWSALRAVQAKADKGGVAFDDELRVLKNTAAAHTAGKDTETANIIQEMINSMEESGAAVEGVKSLPSLSGWFSNSLLPKIQSVSLVPAEHEAGVLSHVASALLSKVLFTRKAGFVEGDDVGAVLARAEYYLGQKDLDMAAREVNQLSGWAGKLAGDWLREARKRLAVEQALQVVAMEATLNSLLLV